MPGCRNWPGPPRNPGSKIQQTRPAGEIYALLCNDSAISRVAAQLRASTAGRILSGFSVKFLDGAPPFSTVGLTFSQCGLHWREGEKRWCPSVQRARAVKPPIRSRKRPSWMPPPRVSRGFFWAFCPISQDFSGAEAMRRPFYPALERRADRFCRRRRSVWTGFHGSDSPEWRGGRM